MLYILSINPARNAIGSSVGFTSAGSFQGRTIQAPMGDKMDVDDGDKLGVVDCNMLGVNQGGNVGKDGSGKMDVDDGNNMDVEAFYSARQQHRAY